MNKPVVSEEEFYHYRSEATAYIAFLLQHLVPIPEELFKLRGALSDDIGELLLNYVTVHGGEDE